MEPLPPDTLMSRAEAIERQFEQCIAARHPPLDKAISLIQDYRVAADEILSSDFLYARAHDVETHLWTAHARLNAHLRKQLSQLRKARPPRPVEMRKFMKLYLEFLKQSQRFYREYIQKLNARFGGIVQLQSIAGQVRSEAAHAHASALSSNPDLEEKVVLSCHQTLIYLGDLFRYRAAERLDKEPDWGPAIGYYSLAATLRPSSGMAFHQQSVIAFEQGDFLRSTYYLYRSIVVQEPHPNAIVNLKLQFKKISEGWDKGDLVPKPSPRDPKASRKALVAWFIRFHSLCHKGEQFNEHGELQREVLGRLTTELKKGNMDGTLLKMVFINLSAQHCAAEQFKNQSDKSELMQSYFFFLAFNVHFFTTLLDAFRNDVLEVQREDRATRSGPTKSIITNLGRLMLPSLRLYSAWLLTNSHILVAQIGDETLELAVAQFWKSYAATLSVLTAHFPLQKLPQIAYQLEEDVDAFSFQPLQSDRTTKLWFDEMLALPRPKCSDLGSDRKDGDTEMLSRVRDLLFDGLLLAVDKDVPLNSLDGSQFIFGATESTTPQLPTQQTTSDNALGTKHVSPSASHRPTPAPKVSATDIAKRQHTAKPATSKRGLNREAQLSRMVDDLVGTEDEGESGLPPTPPAQGFAPAFISAPDGGPYGSPAARTNSTFGLPAMKTPDLRLPVGHWTASNSPLEVSPQRLGSVSGVWNPSLPQNTSPLFSNPNQNPLSALDKPRASSVAAAASLHLASHSRNHSTTAHCSPTVHPSDGWSSFEPTPLPVPRRDRLASLQGPGLALEHQQSGMRSPFLFGLGGGPWSSSSSSAPRRSLLNGTPPNGQGG